MAGIAEDCGWRMVRVSSGIRRSLPGLDVASPHLTRSIVRSPCLLHPTSQEYDTGSQLVSGSEGGCVEPSIQRVPVYVL